MRRWWCRVAGVLSAVGLLTALRRRDLVRSWPMPDDHRGLVPALAALADRARALVAGATVGVRRGRGEDAVGAGDAEVTTALDCRYRGQSHELTVASVAAFHDEHGRRNGYARPEDPVEVVALRASAVRPPAAAAEDLPPPERAVPASWPARPRGPARLHGWYRGGSPGAAGAGAHRTAGP